MATEEELREQAEQYRQLAKTCTTPGLAELLLALAANYLEHAFKVSRSTMASQPQQQQQQIQPKKEE